MPVGFEFRYDFSGQNTPIQKSYVIADAEIFSIGEMVNLESGELDSGVAADTALVGPVVSAVDNTDDGLSVKVIINPFAVYAVTDANARAAGATLDLAAGGLTVTTSSSATFVVVEDSSATEETLVAFNGTHYLNP
jgi:hypothetical protein